MVHDAFIEQCTKEIELLLEGKIQSKSLDLPDNLSDKERIFFEKFNTFLEKYSEGTHFALEVCKGNIKVAAPTNNRIVEPFKQVQANLLHLLWHTTRLSEGDFDQSVMFMGEFSESFTKLNDFLIERRELLEKINRSEQFYKTILRILPDDISITDMNGNLTFVSQKAYDIFGYESPEDFLGKNVFGFLVPEYHEKAVGLVSKMIKGTYTGPGEYQAYKNDGSVIWIDANAEVLLDDNNEPEALLFVIRDITLKREMEKKLMEYAEQMARNARFDLMTGMLNRTEGIRVLEQCIKRCIRYNNKLVVVYMDLDGLKQANDTYGHKEGDKLIMEFTNIIQMNLRDTDSMVRMGGDEFVLILPNIDTEDVEKIIERITERVEESNRLIDFKAKLSFSYGTSILDPLNPISPDELILVADQRMYEKKRRKKMNR